MMKNQIQKYVVLIIILFFVVIGSIIVLFFQFRKNFSNYEVTPTVFPSELPSEIQTLESSWKIYKSDIAQFSFRYPPDYKFEANEVNQYLSLQSMNSTPVFPGGPVGGNDLKLEILIDSIKQNETLEQYSEEMIRVTREDAREYQVFNKTKIKLGNEDGIRWQWKGYGDGESIVIFHSDKIILIQKYPLETERQAEFEKILSSFKAL